MAASRASSLRALNRLAVGSNQVRGLHMTGPTTFSSLLTTERPAINLPRDIAGLRAECQKRNLPTTGSKTELTDRLSAHETINSRAYSTARPSLPSSPATITSQTPTRHFNTSRALKAVKDTSTIDFAYLPADFDPDLTSHPYAALPRVPLLPSNVYANKSEVPSYANVKMEGEAGDAEVMKPEIVTMSADSTHIHAPSAMSETGGSVSVDFEGMAATVARNVGKKEAEVGGMVKQVWGGFVDDLFGPKGQGGHKAA